MSRIKIYDKYASIKKHADESEAHGLQGDTIERLAERFEKFVPKMAGVRANTVTEMDKILPKNASWSPEAFSKRGNVPGGVSMGGNTFHTNQRPYDPAFESPDRQMYPVHRILANRYWRLFYKLDPVIGTAVDLRSELMWGNFTLSGEGIDGEVKDTLEYMVEETKLRTMLPYLNREYDVVGEVAPHLFFDDAKGIWTHLTLLNPDQLEIIDAPFIRMEPIAEFVPDDRLYEVLTSNNVLLRQVRDTMPAELVSRLMSRQNIPLLPTNFTFIPRKLHPYDVRGTSIISRMWRILMYEDCFRAGTMVSLADGSSKPIEQVCVGDKVLDRLGYEQIVTASVEKSPQKLYEIKLFGGVTLAATATHRWPVWAYPRTCQCGCGEDVNKFKSFKATHVAKNAEITWKTYGNASDSRWSRCRLPSAYNPYQKIETKDLKVEDYLLVPRKFDVRETDATPDYARLLGYYLAEGSISQLSNEEKVGVHFDFHINEKETYAKDVVDICAKLGVVAQIYDNAARNACTVTVHKYEYSWLAEKLSADAGRFSHAKQLSAEVISWPVRLKRELLIGYWRGDGSKTIRLVPTRSISLSWMTVSEQLASQLWLVCAQVGWPVTSKTITRHRCKDGRNRKLRHEMTIKGPLVDEVIKATYGIVIERSVDSNAWSKVWLDDDFVYYPIKAITKLEDEEPVFGLTVSGDHSYIANGLGTYNSIFNASIATARRASAPLKVAKLGNPASGWIPDPDNERRLLELLAQAELDPQCFTPETLVTLGDGTHRQIGNIKPGDVVLDRNGHPSEVADVYDELTHDLVRITLAGGEEFDCTPNHAWPVFGSPRVCQCGCDTPISQGNFAPFHAGGKPGIQYWRHPNAPRKIKDVQFRFLKDFDPNQRLAAKDIRPGDFLKMPRSFKERAPTCTEDQAWLLGLYAAEGNIVNTYLREDGTVRLGVEWSLNAAETHLADRIDTILGRKISRFFNREHNLQVCARTNGDTGIATWLAKHAGTGARDKSLSVEVMQWPLTHKLAFLEGYVAGDGAAVIVNSGRAVIEVSSASLQLIRQVKQIITQLGSLASFEEHSQPINSFGHGNTIYRLQIYGELAADLAINAKNVDAIRPKRHKSFSWSDENYVYARVLKVEQLHFAEPKRVVNLSVHGDHSYQVCGVGTYNSWLCYHYGVQFELVGDPGRVMTIDKHWDLIERVKMVAMGISKSFVHGEVSYASAATGLTVFLQSLKARRQMFEAQWLMPKFFKPVSVINKWVKPSQAELSHRVRVRRSHRELLEDKRYIMPTLTWDRTLDPSIDAEMIRAMQALQQLGIKFSPSTLMSTVHRDFQEEIQQLARDGEHMKKMYGEHPELAFSMGSQGPGGNNTVMAPPLPGIPPEQFGDAPAPEPAAAPEAPVSSIWNEEGKYGCWHQSDLQDLISLMHGGDVDSEPWSDLAKDPRVQVAIQQDDHAQVWSAIEGWMTDHDYPARDIIDLEDILKHYGVVRSATFEDLEKLIDGPIV
jgi:intein/homing endonuclease